MKKELLQNLNNVDDVMDQGLVMDQLKKDRALVLKKLDEFEKTGLLVEKMKIK